MKTIIKTSIVLAAIAVATSTQAANFTDGNLVIFRMGPQTGGLTNAGTVVWLDEYTTNGGFVQSVMMPTNYFGANSPLIANGTAFGNGLITRSVDGRFILVGGYGATLSTNASSSVGTTLGTEAPRVIALVGGNTVIDSTTALTNNAVDNQEPRSAASTDGTNIWAAGGTSGGFIEYTVRGTNDGTNLSQLNTRQVNIYSNQLYLTSAGFGGNPPGAIAVLTNAFGTTLPMATNGVGNLGVSAVTSNVFSAWGFAAFKLNAGGSDPIDTLYILDAGSLSAGAQKYSLVSGNWVFNGIVASVQNLVGLAANMQVVGSTTNVTLYLSGGGATLTGGDAVYKATDSTGYNGTPTAFTFSPFIGPTPSGRSFRGIAFAPTGNEGSLSGSGHLSVGPVLGLFASGDTGCALSSSTATQTYSLANLGTTTLASWSASCPSNWVSLSPSSGVSLPAGGSITVSAYFNANIVNLPGNLDGVTNTTTITFSDSNGNSTIRAVRLIQHDQDISPSTDFNPSGQPGGPFSPLSKTYTVFNGSNNITLKVNTTSTWANVAIGTTTGSSVSVSLAGCAKTNVSVVVITNGVGGANSLAQNIYQSLLSFSNTTAGTLIDTRNVQLTVGGLLFCDDFSTFNPGNLAGQQGWTAFGGTFNEPVVSNGAVWVGAVGAGNADEPYKNIPMLSNTTAYVAVSMTVTSAPPVTTPLSGGGAPSRIIVFFNQQNEGNFAVEYLSAIDTGTNKFHFLIRGNSFTGYSVDPTDRTYGTKYNLILGCQTGITNMYLWVNPSSSTLDYSTTNATWTTTDVGNSSNWRFGSYSIQNTFSAGPGGGVIPGVGIYKVCITTNYTDAYNDLAGAPPSDPFTTWQNFYFTPAELANPNFSGPNADPLGKGINNTNQFLAGFSPTNSAAYPHVISIVRTDGTNITVTYLGASGDNSYTGGPASRTNVLEVSAGTANGSYSNNYVSTGITNILSGGSGLGQVATMVHTNGASSSTQYYRVRVLVP